MSSSDSTPSTATSAAETTPSNETAKPARLLTGGCMCKSVRYKINRDQCQERMNMSMCHCGTCQAMTGSAFSIGLVVPDGAFSLEDPGNNLRTYENSLPDTTVGYRIYFCGKCGCYLLHEPTPLTGGSARIMTGTLDAGSKGFVAGPTNEIHVKTRVGWLPELHGVNQVEGFGQWPQGWQ